VCRDYVRAVVKLHDKNKEALDAAKIDEWILCGPGAASWIKKYKEETKWFGSAYADPQRKVYETIGIIRVESMFDLGKGPKSEYTVSGLSGWLYSAKTMIQGNAGDTLQQAAVFVLDDTKSLFHYFEKATNDHPLIEDVFRAAGAKL